MRSGVSRVLVEHLGIYLGYRESLSESNPFAEKQMKQPRPSSHLSSSVGRAKGGGGAENPFGSRYSSED